MSMHKISGFVDYSFHVECPHCEKKLDLTSWPYDDDQERYGPAEDELGAALFGFTDKPSKWEGLDIEYRCYGCKEMFSLGSIET